MPETRRGQDDGPWGDTASAVPATCKDLADDFHVALSVWRRRHHLLRLLETVWAAGRGLIWSKGGIVPVIAHSVLRQDAQGWE